MSGGNGSRPAIRFRRLWLGYGPHDGEFGLEAGAVPFVIAGPNGSGKSSLIEGLVRTLYGFRRSLKDDREAHDRRRPWAGGDYAGRIELESPAGVWTIERDFESDEVRVEADGADTPLFEAEANPTRAGESVRRYRALLEEAIGLSKMDEYRRTACIFQGDLPETSLGTGLLRVAAGGHADVQSAHARLREEYRDLTVEPIAEAFARRRKPGRLERLEEEIADLEARAEEARRSQARRGPLVRAREEGDRALARLEARLERLERAFETLSQARVLEESAETSRARLRRLESAARDLDEAMARLELARDRIRVDDRPAHPPDFLERLRALEEGLWPRRTRILAERAEAEALAGSGGRSGPLTASLPVLGGILLAGGLVLGFIGGAWALAGLLAVAGGLAIAGSIALRRRMERRARERGERLRALAAEGEEIEARIGRLLEGVPDPASLTPETAAARRAAFRRASGDRELLEECERALRSAIDAAVRVRAAERVDAGDAEPEAGSVAGGLIERARDHLRGLQEEVAAERNEVLAPLSLQLGEIARTRFELPEGVDHDLDGVRGARRACLDEAQRVREELARVERELASAARPAESPLHLEAELGSRRSDLAGARARARAYRHAYRLVSEAYDAFRRTDEDRLVSAISTHLGAISGGELGPLEVADGLEGARVHLRGRPLPIETPPLSYGQFHAALLAIRMGAADFLAGLGLRLPLLIDDPFVHLDERGAEELWRVLTAAARERQVIVATQDRLLLRYLGVEPHLELSAPAASAPSAAEPATEREVGLPGPQDRATEPTDEVSETRPTADDTGAGDPDLWSHLES